MRAKRMRTEVVKAAAAVVARGGISKRKSNKQAGVFSASKATKAEYKNVDTNIAAAPLTTAGTLTLLNAIAAGNGPSGMVGRKCVLRSVQIRSSAFTGSAAGGGSTWRQLIVYDAESNGAAPAVNDILTNPNPFAPMQLNNSHRFKILMDDFGIFAPNVAAATSASSPSTYAIDRYRKIALDFIGPATAGGPAGITTGAIYLLTLVSDATLTPSVTHFARVRYTDA